MLSLYKHQLSLLRTSLAADFVSFLKNLEPSSVVKSEAVEVPAALPNPASAEDKQTKVSGSAETQPYPGWDRLLHLTDDNYKELFKQHKHLFILFHAKWCANCTDVKPMFATLALSQEFGQVTLAACDADLAPGVVDLVMVDSLPTLQYVRNGRPDKRYAGERTAASVSEYLRTLSAGFKDEL